MGRVLLSCSVVFSFFCLIACGGGSDKEETQATSDIQTTTTTCGNVTVDLEAVDEIVAAAEEAGVDVVEVEEDEEPALDPGVLKTGVIIAACGSTVITDDSTQDNDTTTNIATTSKLITAIYQGEIESLTIRGAL